MTVQADQGEGDPGERLDRFLTERLAVVAASLPPAGKPLDGAMATEVRILEGLSHLRREHLPPQPQPRKRPYLVRGLFVLTAIVITALIFIPLHIVHVEMDVTCSAVTFRTWDAVQLTGLSSLRLLQAISFAPAEFEEPLTLRTFQLRPPLELRPESDGSLTLSSISIPPQSRVSIRKTADDSTWRLEVENAQAMVAATLAHTVSVSSAGERSQTIDFGRGAAIALKAGPAQPRLEIDITPEDATSVLVKRNIRITEIAFDEPYEEGTSEQVGIVRGRASSVIKGTIFNESLAGRQSALRNRETLEITVAEGHVRELRLEAGAVHVNLSASARELKAGPVGALQTLRPSYLEWLAEHHALKLAWASAAWIFGLMAGGVRWWRASDVH